MLKIRAGKREKLHQIVCYRIETEIVELDLEERRKG